MKFEPRHSCIFHPCVQAVFFIPFDASCQHLLLTSTVPRICFNVIVSLLALIFLIKILSVDKQLFKC